MQRPRSEWAVDPSQRRHPRASFAGWVEITAEGRRRLGTGCDLSAGGIGLELRHVPPPRDTRVTSEFALPGISLPLALEGLVAWCDQESGRLGIRFDGVDPGLAELLESFVVGRL
jgi:hypothetical protein